MPDGVRDGSQTGKFSRAEIEPRLRAEEERRKIKPKTPEDISSATGLMPIYREPVDDSAERDEDNPVD